MDPQTSVQSSVSPLPTPLPPLTTTSQALLGGGSTLFIEHQGALYTLRVTRNGKLILTK